ncbi:MAG: cyclic nucleotide-binding domain-containing protein [Deltaproteobacteria bacterium]|nr:cyclic nucleotide-binding domain-containing protein [Deltaproteobacteria bacterium]MBW2052123.1 cyclic nucleotide-binding domain-containing protein [Deltaproteobacteria bacterium]MBW2141944.1 cyclic nucleotide-binding domain-containing protein [Deltaproteobacteria bacterium]MBW2324541.1 cyclic nucleotide-binding domain-containing protein [Deltaproteobacteria bacterium]
MANGKSKTPPIQRLNYKKGELIVKEGDYGISIYKVIKGKVEVFTGTDNQEVRLALVGPDEIIGEMVFLYGAVEPRTASVRAVEISELEAWHPARLSTEYQQMPQTLKYIIDQILKHLIRMNKVYGSLTTKIEEEKEKESRGEPIDSKRRYYRKEIDRLCEYRPVAFIPGVRLDGLIKDISRGGMAMGISPENVASFSHVPGDEFQVSTTLPNGRKLEMTAKIVTIRKDLDPGSVLLGMAFTNLTEHNQKTLGFFLMP